MCHKILPLEERSLRIVTQVGVAKKSCDIGGAVNEGDGIGNVIYESFGISGCGQRKL